MKRGMIVVFVLVIIAAVVGGGLWYRHKSETSNLVFRTAAVRRGEITQSITASGTLQADEVIDVGSQVTGQISSFGTDKSGKQIDYRSEVEKGKVLATIDPSVYKSEVDAAHAASDQAKAAVVSATADLVQLKAKLDQAKRDWDRAQMLGPSDALAQSSYDSYRAAFEIAKANVGVGEAAIVSAQAGVASAQAAVDRAERNLGYCVILSPVDGVIIDRRVNIGQTVVSSLNVSSLFLLAKDLKHMQIWASVNEADVGSIRTGQHVTFTVDAFPNRTFSGEVDKLRYNATMTNNVVTYTVEIVVDNADETLIPYMTANASFEVAKHTDVLLVPNSALRYTPAAERMAPSANATTSTATPLAGASASAEAPAEGSGHKGGHRRPAGALKPVTLWVVDGEFAKPIQVQRGITDGVNTEVSGADISEDLQVITGDAVADDGGDKTVNPFAPNIPRRRGGH